MGLCLGMETERIALLCALARAVSDGDDESVGAALAVGALPMEEPTAHLLDDAIFEIDQQAMPDDDKFGTLGCWMI